MNQKSRNIHPWSHGKALLNVSAELEAALKAIDEEDAELELDED